MNVERAITFVDTIVFANTGKHLSTLQTSIFRGSWSGRKYEEMAREYHCCEQHVKRVGASLWELLSQSLAEKVTKKTMRAIIEREIEFSEYSKQTKNLEQNNPLVREENQSLGSIESELPQGPIEVGSKFYIPREPIESECYREILKPGALITIKAPEAMGKTSLMARIIDRATQQGYDTVSLNFQLADRNFFGDLDLFLKWFCLSVGDRLQLSDRLERYWKDIYGIKRRCHNYFEKYILKEVDRPVLVAIDEVDRIFSHPVADDFFSLLRVWHEQAKSDRQDGVWQKLRLVLSHSTEAYLISDINQSPFNVGLALDLPIFTAEKVEILARRHGLSLDRLEIERLMTMVGGHPYLLQIAFYNLARKKMPLSQFLQVAPTLTGPYSSHLRRISRSLAAQPKLMAAFKLILEQNTGVHLNGLEKFKLYSMGLLSLDDNRVNWFCALYRQYFDKNRNFA